MQFASRMTATARRFDPDRGVEVIDAFDLPTEVKELLHGVAGCSPYLTSLIQQDASWLLVALDHPEAAVEAVLREVGQMSVDILPSGLRRAKRRIALITALADVGGVWPLETVTATLTDFANACVDRCLKVLVAQEIERGKLPGLVAADAETAGGMVALAMGKMGARELNYSSDIDLICLFDETRFDPDAYHDARASFIKVTRRMAAILSDVTAEGYVFRTDLRLRPDASVTPVCLSMETAERYYESVGRTWERAAYIKASACGGDVAAGARFLQTLRPFVWRKHLDFAAIQDAHDMRLRIRDHKGLHGPIILTGHNMKLGRGGIREIEFFTQTRQLIAGGRDPKLRVRGTVEGLAKLADAGWVSDDAAGSLTQHYRVHRTIEHRLQMIQDAQTHSLPKDEAGFARLAAFLDVSVDQLKRDIQKRLENVHDIIEGFFAPDPSVDAAGDRWGEDITQRWPTYPALRSDRAGEIFGRIWPDIRMRLQEAPKPVEALTQFDAFLSGLPSGVQLFSLFEANPQLTQLIVDIAGTAPALSDYLSKNAGVFDAVIGGAFFSPWPGVDGLKVLLTRELAAVEDYEGQLATARRWWREWHFRIGVHFLRGLTDAQSSGEEYADLAEAVVACLWPCVVTQFAEKHGPPPGRGACVLGMGSLGAGRLDASSDLDLIVIYDPLEQDCSDGRRPLSTRPYYARLTQALVTALSAPMADGRLYEVDMRLRPSGRQGPVATSLESFRNYQENEAWTWEHLALTRARTVGGVTVIGEEVEAFRADLLRRKGRRDVVLRDVAEMRMRLATGKPGTGVWDTKDGPGHAMDIALLAQAAALQAGSQDRGVAAQLLSGVAIGWLDAAHVQELTTNFGLFGRIQAASRLLSHGVLDPDRIGEGGRRMVLRETGYQDVAALADALSAAQNSSRVIISGYLGDADEG